MADDDFDPDSSENSSARATVLATLPTDADLDAFASDYFGSTYNEFPSDMQVNDKINLLLKENGASKVLDSLPEYAEKVHEREASSTEPKEEFSVSEEDLDRIVNAFGTSAELDAFLIDYFGDVMKQCSGGMTANQKVELLLRTVGSSVALAKLHDSLGPEIPDFSRSDGESVSSGETTEFTIAEMVELMPEIFRTSADFEAFILDYFSGVYRQFSSGMDRHCQYEVLFQMRSVSDVVNALRSAGETLKRGTQPTELNPPLPDGSVLSEVIDDKFRSITDFNLFVMSNFREVYDQFGSSMTRSERTDLLVRSATPEELIEALGHASSSA